jgi:mannose-6-phosphate isomerase-like protein (cupin superfamily)
MAEINRRELCLALGSLALLTAETADAQAVAGDPVLKQQRAFLFDNLPVTRTADGVVGRKVTRGFLPTGEAVEIHETELPPGEMPHPAHRHVHSEFMMIREGSVAFQMENTSVTLGPGGVAYAASGQLHGLKNVGDRPAQYFVIAIGKEPPPSVA